MNEVDRFAKTIWDYMLMGQKLEQADLIFVLGSSDIRVAEYSADLFLQGYAQKILFSGGVAHKSDLLATNWGDKTEAEMFSEIAVKKGVPTDKILLETRATNTGENVVFSYDIIKRIEPEVKKIILVQKPFMERRTYATFMKHWSDDKTKIIVTSPPISFDDYPGNYISKEKLVNLLVGDLQRMKIYAEKEFQVPQNIPRNVWTAFEQLKSQGYTKHLIKE